MLFDFSNHPAESDDFLNEGIIFQRGLKFNLHNRRSVPSRQQFIGWISQFDVPVGGILTVNLALRFGLPEQFRRIEQRFITPNRFEQRLLKPTLAFSQRIQPGQP